MLRISSTDARRRTPDPHSVRRPATSRRAQTGRTPPIGRAPSTPPVSSPRAVGNRSARRRGRCRWARKPTVFAVKTMVLASPACVLYFGGLHRVEGLIPKDSVLRLAQFLADGSPRRILPLLAGVIGFLFFAWLAMTVFWSTFFSVLERFRPRPSFHPRFPAPVAGSRREPGPLGASRRAPRRLPVSRLEPRRLPRPQVAAANRL